MGKAYLPEGFESAATVESRKQKLVRQLSRSDQFGAMALAQKLAACSSGSRCRSGACPVCQRRWRRNILKQVSRMMPREPLLRISWVPRGGLVRPGQLVDFNLPQFLASRRRAIERALPGVVVFGGVDVSLNTMNNDAGVWQLHLYLLTVVEDTREMRKRVRKRCVGERSAPRPIQFKLVGDPARAFSYATKSQFYRRSRYKHGRWNTVGQSLTAPRSVEAALFLDRWHRSRRLVLCGLRPYHETDRIRLVRLPGRPVVKGRRRGRDE